MSNLAELREELSRIDQQRTGAAIAAQRYARVSPQVAQSLLSQVALLDGKRAELHTQIARLQESGKAR